MFADGLDANITKSIKTICFIFRAIISFVFRAINLLYNCNKRYLLQIKVKLKKLLFILIKSTYVAHIFINTFVANANKFIKIINI